MTEPGRKGPGPGSVAHQPPPTVSWYRQPAMATGDALGRIRDALEGHDCRPQGDGARMRARCPGHQSHGLTLSVSQGRSGALIKCFAGCETDDVLAALGLSWDDAFDEPRQRKSFITSSIFRRPATAADRLIAVFARAVGIINLRSDIEAAAGKEPLTPEERVQLAEDDSRKAADDHYWNVVARWAALATDDAYIRRVLLTPIWKRTHEQHAALMTRRSP